MDGFLLINPGAYLLINGLGGRLLISRSPVPPPPGPPSGSGVGGGGRGARGRKIHRQSPQPIVMVLDDDQLMAVIQRFLDVVD